MDRNKIFAYSTGHGFIGEPDHWPYVQWYRQEDSRQNEKLTTFLFVSNKNFHSTMEILSSKCIYTFQYKCRKLFPVSEMNTFGIRSFCRYSGVSVPLKLVYGFGNTIVNPEICSWLSNVHLTFCGTWKRLFLSAVIYKLNKYFPLGFFCEISEH